MGPHRTKHLQFTRAGVIMNALAVIAQTGVLPVIVIDSPDQARPLGLALLDAGIACAEVTLRTPNALAAIEALSGIDGLTVGAGTVIDPDQVGHCCDAGARFIVSPGFDENVDAQCRDRQLTYLPGAVTATEIQHARQVGVTTLKFFPAEPAGGLPAVQALASPFPDIRFLPTGGIGPGNVTGYLQCQAVIAVGGSWMVQREDIRSGNFTRIGELSRQAVRLVDQARGTSASSARPDLTSAATQGSQL
jgi:2-dehydro-3-deoxyphosphogluconate aldolase/(4S)-4-hydroxy-2-oxoglutarate aldolase